MENILKVLEVVCLSSDATLPVQAYDSQAGWDLFSANNCVILPNSQLLVPTNIACSANYRKISSLLPQTGR